MVCLLHFSRVCKHCDYKPYPDELISVKSVWVFITSLHYHLLHWLFMFSTVSELSLLRECECAIIMKKYISFYFVINAYSL